MSQCENFGNIVCNLLLKVNNFDLEFVLDNCFTELGNLYDHFASIVNIYDFIEDVPLLKLYHYIYYGKENFDFSEKEHQEAIKKIKTECMSIIMSSQTTFSKSKKEMTDCNLIKKQLKFKKMNLLKNIDELKKDIESL